MWQEKDKNDFLTSQFPREIPERKLPSASELLRLSFLVFIKKLGTILGISLFGFFTKLALIVGTVLLVALFSKHGTSLFFLIFLIIVFGLLFAFLAELLIVGSLIYAIVNDKGFSESIVQGFKKLPSLFVTSLCAGIVIGLGFLAFFIPGIIFLVWFSFVNFGVMLEGKNLIQALSFSKNLVSGRWWSVAWRLFFGAFIFMILASIIQTLFFTVLTPLLRKLQILLSSFPFPNLPIPFINFGFILRLFMNFVKNLVSWFFTTPLSTAYSCLIYLNLKKVKDLI